MLTVWSLRDKADRRARQGHPWVFSNELAASPKGHEAGAPVMLIDARGSFVAHGYGNPNSLISFRALSFDQRETDTTSVDFFARRLIASFKQRAKLGFDLSFRWCFGEADGLPGLVVDRYLLEDGYQILVLQMTTAGIQKMFPNPEEVFSQVFEQLNAEGLNIGDFAKAAIILRNDSSVRKLEGLQVEEPNILKNIDVDIRDAAALIKAVHDEKPILLSSDFVEGQKTGLFLDQWYNIQVVSNFVRSMNFSGQEKVRILDICSYVGHWSTQLARVLKNKGIEAEVTMVDISEPALAFAKKNASRETNTVIPFRADVVRDMALPDRHYDIVICDPPAFIKAKKDIPTGRHAYLKLNGNAFRMTKSGGLIASCSCSGLFIEEEFYETVKKAWGRQSKGARLLARGGHAPDHPVRAFFPEGQYLKMYLHHLD